MPLRANVYDIDLDPTGDGQLVELRRIRLTHGDELRAEMEASKQRLPLDLPHTFTSLMMWAACTRLGHYGGKFPEWRNGGLVEYRRVTDDELAVAPVDGVRLDDAGQAVVDPTQAEPSDSASASPTGSPDSSPTGSTPTSTSV